MLSPADLLNTSLLSQNRPTDSQITPDRHERDNDSQFQVCSNCKRLKRKCDRQQPSCSRCSSTGLVCEYGQRKRRPGPAKGSVNSRTRFLINRINELEDMVQALSNQRALALPSSHRSSEHDPNDGSPTGIASTSLEEVNLELIANGLTDPTLLAQIDDIPCDGMIPSNVIELDWQDPSHILISLDSPDPSIITTNLCPSNLAFSVKHTLISLYFDHIQPIFPMFRKPAFYQDLVKDRIPDALLISMFAIASRFLPDDKRVQLFGEAPAPWDQFSQLAHQKSREEMLRERNRPVTLNAVKTACLLALYEYTAAPSRQAWILVGNAMRLALMAQLHQVDCRGDLNGLSPVEKEEWRFVWWTIWRLDCTINVTAVTPFGIDCQMMGTALVSTTVANFTAGVVDSTRAIIPEMDPLKSWSSSIGLQLHEAGDGFNTHLFAVSLLRSVSECQQRLNTSPNPEDIRRVAELDEIFSALHLIFPNSFFVPARCPTEDLDTHRLRLETIIMLNTARLIMHEPVGQLAMNAELSPSSQLVSLKSWRDSIGYAEQIASVFDHWQSEYFAVSDPIISCAIWHAYCGLMMFGMSGLDKSGSSSKALENLSMFLNSFTPWWPIARALQDSLRTLQAWSWAKLDVRRLVGLIAHIRKAFSPCTSEPGKVDVALLCGSVLPDLSMCMM